MTLFWGPSILQQFIYKRHKFFTIQHKVSVLILNFFCITHRTLRHKLLNVMKICDQLQKIQLNNAVRWFCIFRYINLMAVDISSEQNLTTMRLPFERYPPKVFNSRRDISEMQMHHQN